MIRQITHVSLIVPNQEEAKSWYVEKLGFEVRSDNPFPSNHNTVPDDPAPRWVTLGLPNQPGFEVVLEIPEWGDKETRLAMIGKLPGWVLEVEDCHALCQELEAKGVTITSQPEELPWGISAVIQDLYGHKHNILQPLPPQSK